jgi:hypothetical protein
MPGAVSILAPLAEHPHSSATAMDSHARRASRCPMSASRWWVSTAGGRAERPVNRVRRGRAGEGPADPGRVRAADDQAPGTGRDRSVGDDIGRDEGQLRIGRRAYLPRILNRARCLMSGSTAAGLEVRAGGRYLERIYRRWAFCATGDRGPGGRLPAPEVGAVAVSASTNGPALRRCVGGWWPGLPADCTNRVCQAARIRWAREEPASAVSRRRCA